MLTRKQAVVLHISKALIVAALVLSLYAAVVVDLADDWFNDSGASHGFLVPPMALYAAWVGRDRILAEPAVPDAKGLWAVTAACVLFLLGRLGADIFLARISLVVLIAGFLWTFWGQRRLRLLFFPLLLLLTMIPPPTILYNQLAVPLQLLASSVAADVSERLGLAVHLDGNLIYLRNISLGVTEACSGLRSLSSLIVLALILGFVQRAPRWTRLTLLAAAFPVAIGVNILRIIGTAILANHDERFAMGFYHLFSGWVAFLAGIAIFCAASWGLRRMVPGA